MPQMLIPFFPPNFTIINSKLGFEKRDGYVWYFNGNMPIFHHAEADLASFRMICAQLYILGNAAQSEIKKAFGLSDISVKRWVKRYRENGPSGFYETPKRRGASVLTKPILEQAQTQLDEGKSPSSVSKELGVKYDTFRKAVSAGRLHTLKKKPMT